MSSPAEERRAPRVPRHVIARHRTTRVPAAAWLMSPLLDLSRAGARFLSEYAFEAGEGMEVELLLPNAPHPLPLRASVAWAKPSQGQLTEVGVSFDVNDAASQQTLEAAVAVFLQHQRMDQASGDQA